MRICVAPDKFKGSLAAPEAARVIARGLRRWLPDVRVDVVPVADGGDGTAQTIVAALGGRFVPATVTGPDGRPVKAAYGRVDDRTAVIELAQASGLGLVDAGRNDPMTATTAGTGELIAAAIDAGATRIILAIGGSATNDAGSGALAALGAGFFDRDGKTLEPGGAALARLHCIDTAALERRLRGVTIEIASDVANPLCGPRGASAVYAPQKGASPAQVQALDAALCNFAAVVRQTAGIDIADVPGAGAAGGVGGGFLGLAHATLRPGAQLVLELLDFPSHLEGATLVITGEGKLDRQTLSGKAPYAVAQAAKQKGIPTVALAGTVGCSPQELDEAGICAALSIVPGPMPLDDAMRDAEKLLGNAAEMLARTLTIVRVPENPSGV